MSASYKDLDRTTFPEKVDTTQIWRDPSLSELPLIKEYKHCFDTYDFQKMEQLLIDHKELSECLINADKLLALQHGIVAVQRYLIEQITSQIFQLGEYKGDWNSSMSSTTSSVANKVKKFDIVSYPVDGVKQQFMIISNNIKQGIAPLSAPDAYLPVTIRGEKGDAGHNGADALGLTIKGEYKTGVNYPKDSLVAYNGTLWYNTSSTSVMPKDSGTPWIKLAVTYNAMVYDYNQEDQLLQSLYSNNIWISFDGSHYQMKYKDTNGNAKPIYPVTQADAVQDVSGVNLQTQLYKTYFDRDDVDVTYANLDDTYSCIAKIKGTNIIVAKSIITDYMYQANYYTNDFQAFDNNGELVYHIVQRIDVSNDGTTFTQTTNVIQLGGKS